MPYPGMYGRLALGVELLLEFSRFDFFILCRLKVYCYWWAPTGFEPERVPETFEGRYAYKPAGFW